MVYRGAFFILRGKVFEDFRFDVGRWRSAIEPGIEIPSDVELRAILDPSLTANPSSDRSALVVGFTRTRDSDGINEFVLLDASSNRWRGIQLADASLEFCLKWNIKTLQVERIPGVDLLKDAIALQAKLRNVESPAIRLFNPCVIKGAKNRRILRFRTLFECSPAAIRIQNGTYIPMLFEEIENFIPTPSNRGRQVNILDACALCAGFR